MHGLTGHPSELELGNDEGRERRREKRALKHVVGADDGDVGTHKFVA